MNSQLTEQRSSLWRKRVLRAAWWCPWLIVAAAYGDYQTFNSQNHADNAAFRTNWLNAIDIASADVQYKADFEAGFTNGQNISNAAGLLPGGLIIRDTSSANAAVVRSGASIVNGSNPVGVFCVTCRTSSRTWCWTSPRRRWITWRSRTSTTPAPASW